MLCNSVHVLEEVIQSNSVDFIWISIVMAAPVAETCFQSGDAAHVKMTCSCLRHSSYLGWPIQESYTRSGRDQVECDKAENSTLSISFSKFRIIGAVILSVFSLIRLSPCINSTVRRQLHGLLTMSNTCFLVIWYLRPAQGS